jgi:L-amino acid N-acyltransferase YncA
MNYRIAPLQPDDWPAVREIYAEGIATGNATFETELPAWEKWDSGHRADCRLLARDDERVLGWAALSPISTRRVYAGVAEVSVYVAAAARGRGVGKALLKKLMEESEANGIWTLQAGIFPENTASIALHKSCGFHEVGVRRRIGKLGNTWRDVLLLERRSPKID